MNCICPECGKEITPVINAGMPNINGCAAAAQPMHSVLNLVYSVGEPLSVYTNVNTNGCNPTIIPHIVTIPPR